MGHDGQGRIHQPRLPPGAGGAQSDWLHNVTAALNPVTEADALTPVRTVLRTMHGPDRLTGIAPDLLVTDPLGWAPATALTSGDLLPELLRAAARRWEAGPAAAAALAWKSYSYRVALPAVVGWATVRRVPIVTADAVLVRLDDPRTLVTVGLRGGTRVAVLPSDPLARVGGPTIDVVSDEVALLDAVRVALLDDHLTPLLGQVRQRARLGDRTLLGSVASGVATALVRAGGAVPGPLSATIITLLQALDLAGLVDLVPADGGLAVHRRTCCLAFTLPQPKICSGCCIRPLS